ncbi:penicillin-binding protein [Flavobacterium saliperosum S13]|uniref:CubicO group peptidase, beta-lactamase class C family n=2 Tax=Flavobacterium saliperosum TaxID=329186 RepID=A0A1G4V7V9_9FLAO|nr:serine hydrolase domain-containing protein [Flavobacterium saliperosum]ESU28019.1 penicillin-binding protein [Flavobacterium saliperosum S13]SCX02588.1 CubicO group peptidase, beta-lactamase class C family [Flavobacterium saliperosum]
MKKTLFLFVFLLSLTISAQESTRFRKMDSLLTYLNTNNRFMGQLSIREGDNVVFSRAYGIPKSKQQPDGYTKYKIGSITKTFTAVMIMQLVEEKRLKLEEKLSKFYPKIPNADKITINDLLRHRTGIPDYVNADSTANMTLAIGKKEMLAKIAAYQPVFEPNTKAEYSNSNYYLLGCIIEDLTKTPYKTNLKNRIVNKLKLKNTYMVDKTEAERNEVVSYTYNGEQWEAIPEWDMSLPFAAGAISSTANDLTAFMRAIFSGKLLKPSSVDEMTQLRESYGIGLVTFPFGERKFFGHTGGIEGFKSVVGYYPAEKLGISLIVNGDNFNRNDIMIGILSIYYKMPFAFPNVKSVKVDETVLKSYEGTYSSKEIPLKINIKADKGQIIAQATGQGAFPLNPVSETEFVFDPAGVNMTFGEKTMLLKQGGMEIKFVKE